MTIDPRIIPINNIFGDISIALVGAMAAFVIGKQLILWRLPDLATFIPPHRRPTTADEPPSTTQVWQPPPVPWLYTLAALIASILPLWMWFQVQATGCTVGSQLAPYSSFFDSVADAAFYTVLTLIGVIILTVGYRYSPKFQSALFTRSYTPQRVKAVFVADVLLNLLLFPLIALREFLVCVLGYPNQLLLPYPLGWILILGTLVVCWSPYIYIYLREKLE